MEGEQGAETSVECDTGVSIRDNRVLLCEGPKGHFWAGGSPFFCGLCIVETAVLEEKLLEIKK